jgi:hypothetical protein
VPIFFSAAITYKFFVLLENLGFKKDLSNFMHSFKNYAERELGRNISVDDLHGAPNIH